MLDTDSGAARPAHPTRPKCLRHDRRGPGGQARSTSDRRDAIRRNHTGTHLLHWALREVLGTHVKQPGSLVAPDRLRFDFSHHTPVSAEELARIEAMVNERILANEPVRAYETTKEDAERLGAIAFFGDKYGDIVRVVEAGGRSMELCGGTHVGALGAIGPVQVVSEGSIGSNSAPGLRHDRHRHPDPPARSGRGRPARLTC